VGGKDRLSIYIDRARGLVAKQSAMLDDTLLANEGSVRHEAMGSLIIFAVNAVGVEAVLK